MFGRSTAGIDRLIDKATSQLLLEPDWDSIIQICDFIRGGDASPKYVVSILRKKINSENPHISLYALQVLESCVKNCGSLVHQEVATKEFMEFFKDIVKVRPDPVKAKICELIQVWSHAFRNEPGYKVVQDTFHLMKMEGYTFPQLKEADAMFTAEKAPEWKDGEVCHRCRVQFTMVQRKHHCRNCGQVFCGKCSSKTSIIPRFGIEKEVRVCDSCFDQLNKPTSGKKEDDLPSEYVSSPLAQQAQVPPTQNDREQQEEEELALAIALSKSEAEAKAKERDRLRNNYSLYSKTTTAADSSTPPNNPTYAQPVTVTAPMLDTSDMDPELARYLNRNYWEQKRDDQKSASAPSAPTATSEAKGQPNKTSEIRTEQPNNVAATVTNGQELTNSNFAQKYQNGEVGEEEQFLNALRSSIEIFVNRMKSNSLRGRSIANDSSVQTLFMTLNSMHPQLLKYMDQQDETRSHYESLQDKLAQIRDAREALDALREEHREKRRREQEELERQRQIAMAHKLEIMRQKKQEYLEYQRQLALQRMAEQEREMQMRLEQQKQLQHMRAMGYAFPPQMYGPGQVPGQTFSPAGSVEGSPHHQPHPGAPYNQPMHMGGPPGQPPAGPPGPGFMYGPEMPPYGGPPGGYQPPGAGFQGPGSNQPPPPGQQGPPPGQQGVPGGQPPPPPGQQQQPQQQYPPGPPPPPHSMPEYNSFNMQAVNNALPAQGGPPAGPPTSQPPPPPQGFGAPGVPGHFGPPPPEGHPLPQGAPPQGATSPEAQLICFD